MARIRQSSSFVEKKSEASRLDPQAWISMALQVMAERGVEAIRVEPLAKLLGVTKGSFYWHFRDRDALLEAMLNHWRKRATLAIIDRIEGSSETPQDRMRNLLRLPMTGPRSEKGAAVELAIRMWGRTDEHARAALAEVDSLRIRYIASLLTACGVASGEAEARAIVAYSYLRVAASLLTGGAEAQALREQCEAFLMTPA